MTNMDFQTNGSSYPTELLRVPRWYALRTRARSEKQADRLLREAGVECYPAVAQVRRDWSDRVQDVGIPLFPGYVFARFALNEIVAVLTPPPVVGVVRTNGAPQPVREEEMEAVRRLAEGATATGELPSDEDYLTVGDSIVVADGPFKGMEGILVEERGRTRLVVRIPSLRQAKGVVLERGKLRRARAG